MARASVGGAIVITSLHLVDDVVPGDYVLIHTGFALQKISEEEALETIRIIRELESDTLV
jgi:hydrogenase expression/formation protein HypC